MCEMGVDPTTARNPGMVYMCALFVDMYMVKSVVGVHKIPSSRIGRNTEFSKFRVGSLFNVYYSDSSMLPRILNLRSA